MSTKHQNCCWTCLRLFILWASCLIALKKNHSCTQTFYIPPNCYLSTDQTPKFSFDEAVDALKFMLVPEILKGTTSNSPEIQKHTFRNDTQCSFISSYLNQCLVCVLWSGACQLKITMEIKIWLKWCNKVHQNRNVMTVLGVRGVMVGRKQILSLIRTISWHGNRPSFTLGILMAAD